MNYTLLVTLLLISCLRPHNAEDIDLDSVLERIFGSQNISEPTKKDKVEALLEIIFGDENANFPPIVKRSANGAIENRPCTTTGGMKGECLPYYLCNESQEIVESEPDVRSPLTACENFLDVCCRK